MRNSSKAPGGAITSSKAKRSRSMRFMSYSNIAGCLASQMVEFLRSSESRASAAPFTLVLIGNHGDVVFECEMSEDWKIRRKGTVSRVRHTHFPATALLTDRSLVTRTFLIESEPLLASVA